MDAAKGLGRFGKSGKRISETTLPKKDMPANPYYA
jgi:hypothetical protein